MEILEGKRVFIAGASGGIGSHAAKLLKQSGADVFLAGRNLSRLREIAHQLRLPDGNVIEMDICNARSVNDAVASVVATGKIDILINATGIGIIRPVEQLSTGDFEKTIQTNLVGAFYLVKSVLPGMKEEKKGLIINIPGVLGKVPMAGAAAYSASKYGLTGMMQSIREEIKRTEIRITNIFLGGVDSPFWDTIDLRVQRDKMIDAGEAARAIWFLCQQPRSAVVSEMVLQPFNHQAI
jgi:NADP-dependent 3-hydroxy acid dehydrogenase YdfG